MLHDLKVIPRRTVVKGLVGLTLTISGIRCAPAGSSTTPAPAKILTGATSAPSASPTPGPTLYTYSGHSGWVFAVAWSPDGKRIASTSNDVEVWDAIDGGHAFIYSGHSSNAVRTVAWNPGGKRIASAGDDKQSRSGIRRAESSPSSTMGIMTMCLPWPGRPMADILPRPVVIRRYRSGMHLVAGISLPIGDTPMAWVLWRGYQMADTLFQPVMIQLRRCGKRNETNHQAVYPSVKHEKKEQAYVFSSDLPANNKKERPVTSAGAIPICLWHNTCSNIPHCDAIRPGARDSDGGCNSHGECSYTFYPACDIQRTPGERHQSSLVA